jgi:hypothetical protein
VDWRWLLAASLLLSLWLVAIDPVINRDAILYLRAAEAYLDQGLLASQALHGRPVLSICIAWIHQLTGIPLLYCGLVLNAAFYAVLVLAFVATVAVLGGDRRTQLFAAALILSHPILNEYRSSIMRDPAYWALLMVSVRELLCYLRTPSLRHGLGWFLAIALAAVFRFEGLFIALVLPLVLMGVSPHPRRLQHGFALLLPALAVTALAALLLSQGGRDTQNLFPAIDYYLGQLRDLETDLAAIRQQTGEALLVFTARDDAGTAVFAGLTAVLLLNICRAVTWPLLLLWLWGLARGLVKRIDARDRRLLTAHMVVAFAYLALFMLTNRFVIERYSSVITLFVLAHLAFILAALWQRASGRLLRYAVVLLLVGLAGDSLHNGDYRKAFIRDATQWLKQNTPAEASIASNEMYVAYFSRRDYDWSHYEAYDYRVSDLGKRPELWHGRDYLVMTVKPPEMEDWQQFAGSDGREEIAVFAGSSGTSVRVLRLPEDQ